MNAAERPSAKILVVEDDATIATMLTDRLESKGYSVCCASTAADAETMAEELDPQLIIVDLMLPDTHGLVLCANLREKRATPIIICSATTRKEDAVLGLKLGADDFIAKPVSVDELLARVEAALRRAGPNGGDHPSFKENVQRVGELVIDQARCQVMLGSQRVWVTPIEYRLLCALASRPNHVLSRQELAERTWGSYDYGIDRALNVHVRRLRAKLQAGGASAPSVMTVRGFGYQLAREAEQADATAGV
jgi:two-component system, OmpR family, response regulator MtrA